MQSEETILARVDSALKSHPHLRRVIVKSKQEQDRLVLRGSVDSFFQKQMAQEALRDIPGVDEIDNQLSVDY
ncbi:BON domain-containing protein [Roseimaritima sediminicola]|uniref:BON domain-containing protein n=1 Tax=Roseimaritima sediminicola TaxID=2662066 RepID=UPI0012982DB2|nr:BON domain-containing protein [Roseimaritima sediminicola]